MTLCQKIILINQLVKKEPDTTIKEYLDIVAEIDRIRESFKNGVTIISKKGKIVIIADQYFKNKSAV